MSGKCKGRCPSLKDYRRNGGKYADGFCRCIVCDAVFRYEGIFCPCCSTRVRRRSYCVRKPKVVARY